MDDKWFKQRQKIAGVTADDIAAQLGRHPSTVSKIYSGQKRMTMDWAKAFAVALGVTLDEVLEKSGEIDHDEAQTLKPGFAESDVALWSGKGQMAEAEAAARMGSLLGARPGIDIWRVKTLDMVMAGYMPGDFMLVDTHQSELVKAGDVVVAQVYDWNTGTARTILRRFSPPVLVSASPNPEAQRVFVVDGSNVLVKGKVVASWRV